MTRRALQDKAVPKVRANGRRPRNYRKAPRALLVLLFFSSALVGCVSSYALQTPDLVVKEIKISNVNRADRAEVQKAAKGLLGKNILVLRKSPVIDDLCAVHEVESVKIGRDFPCKMWVRLTERKPAAILVTGGKSYLLQSDGLAFHKVSKPENGLPILSVADCGKVSEGTVCASSGVRSALKIVGFAGEHRLTVAKISVDPLGDICLNMGSGFYVKLGQPDEMARKMSLLRDALVYKPSLAREAAYIDLSCPSAPVWKPKAGAGPTS